MLHAVVAAAFEDIEGASHIAAHVGVRSLQGITHTGLRREVHDAAEFLLRKQVAHRAIIRQVELHEAERGQLLQLSEPRLLEGDVVVLVEVVEPDDLVTPGQQALGRVKADESSRAGQQIFHRRPSVWGPGNTCLMSYST